ncbi:hypothetical protein M2311_006554 [Rhizobium leguminosarum]|nr:hypothetical protein [Rhizobium leguminosarum]MDH6276449.1 hypothetical protein [Rhizobium leguminosarum]
MRILRPVVQAFMRAVFHVRHELAFSRPVGAQFVGDHMLWRRGLLVQKSRQQALDRLGVTSRLDDLIEHISVLINRSPQPAFLTVDAHTTSIELPNVAAKGLPQKSQFHNVDYARFTRKTGKLCIINL